MRLNSPVNIILLRNFSTNIIGKDFKIFGFKTVSISTKTIDLLHLNSRHDIISGVGVYCIPCKECKLKYIGEYTINVHKYIYEHIRDIRSDNLNNAVFLHIPKTDHNFDFNASTMLVYILNKRLRQIFEAGAISLYLSLINVLDFLTYIL